MSSDDQSDTAKAVEFNDAESQDVEKAPSKPARKSTRGRKPRKTPAQKEKDDSEKSSDEVKATKKEAPKKVLFSSDDDSAEFDFESDDDGKKKDGDVGQAAPTPKASGASIFPPKPKETKPKDDETTDTQRQRDSASPLVEGKSGDSSESRDPASSPQKQQNEQRHHNKNNQQGGGHFNQNKKNKFDKKKKRKGGGGGGPPPWKGGGKQNKMSNIITIRIDGVPVEWDRDLDLGDIPDDEELEDIQRYTGEESESVSTTSEEVVEFNKLYEAPLPEIWEFANQFEIRRENLSVAPNRRQLLQLILKKADAGKKLIVTEGVLEILEEGYGLLVYAADSYRLKPLNVFVPEILIRTYGLQRGHLLKMQIETPQGDETCLIPKKLISVNGLEPENIADLIPFTELTPYYPTKRILLESDKAKSADFLSMRIVDLISPIGFGQRGLIVAPPRTGKTVLLQGIANSLRLNNPDVHLIILLIDERPEEVTDFRRHVDAEIISSTFDENAESHVHAAEVVIEKARRMVEAGQHVVILLDSITRLARAYNTLMPNSGKILSGGVEAGALQKPKRFFGSARNIEGAGSLTIMGTALIDTGSKMDEVVFEEFKGTGNMELHLDRGLSDKRIFPALSMDRSGTRKEELLYHQDEMAKVYSLRRAMKGVPPNEAMEMLIQRVKKTNSNAEFLMTLNR